MGTVEINRLESAIEAILFTMGDSVELGKIASAIEHDEETTRKIVHQMMDKYQAEDRGIQIVELEDSFQLCTKKQNYDYLIRIAKQPRRYVLTDVLLVTLPVKWEGWMRRVNRFCLERQKNFCADSVSSL